MRSTRLTAVLVGLAVLAMVAADAQAYYHPGMGRFVSRDPGTGIAPPVRLAGPTGNAFIPRDPTGSEQYADGLNLYAYCKGSPTDRVDPKGTRTTSITVWKMNTKYHHRFVVLEANESYGWYPDEDGDTGEEPGKTDNAITGIEGVMKSPDILHGVRASLNKEVKTETKSCNWFQRHIMGYVPKLEFGPAEGKGCGKATDEDIKKCIRDYARLYPQRWPTYRLGPNDCWTFVDRALHVCCLKMKD